MPRPDVPVEIAPCRVDHRRFDEACYTIDAISPRRTKAARGWLDHFTANSVSANSMFTMSESKTRCVACPTPIDERTADEHDGLCAPCYYKSALAPPDGFEIAPDLVQRLVAMGEDPAEHRQMAWRVRAELFQRHIDKLEARKRHFDDWSSRLYEFSRTCREENPSPRDEELSDRDRGIQRVYQAKFETPPLEGDNEVAICQMPLIAMPVAQRCWVPDGKPIVLLTPDEISRWDEMPSRPEDPFRWETRHWWHVDDSPRRQYSIGEVMHTEWEETDIPDGHAPWLVTVGHASAPICGWGQTELWLWNGTVATFARITMEWVS
jgi:hypothetical protein